ncbi:MAG: UDP-N-acetylglucosamine 1-carboxyvinyltransferase [Candidatus Yanofskybacteria bacterium CG10_big_fil_rev_8_21_14_0_10_36_16]|uniref:UDP-N-acetylglucosamine 1-carboxyvinyltransferase n=1 Tax=Candidatus Yanofskybacteria bacterium CG10_big_fil_rev_8_21_14_0_10_36_16 TaxID=1975096 RepID=A0A2J0Q813_9BACT|nr:MAG: UDP-N-acetylglucosamine 1-carboxyvinyltransferase [Candidatus Yanofskybacteria bacterium CG10_big_fil_rev_8_21_14_0_10_36_16]
MKTYDSTAQKKLGQFIKNLRKQRGLSQAQFAKALATSQPAVARMESGKQNFSTGELLKISRILDRKILAIPESLDFEIRGGQKVSGSITTNFSKNGSVSLLCASLLNQNKTTLHGIARIEEINRLIEIMESMGVNVRWVGTHSLEITPPKKLSLSKINSQSASRVRSSLMLIGPSIHNKPSFRLPHAGGCKMGNRTITAHRFGLEKLGINIETKRGYYDVRTTKLKPAEITMYEASDTATNNVLMASALIPGTTKISFAPPNYQVQELCFFLEKMGVKIDGIGTTSLVVHGISKFNKPLEYHNSEDPIEAMMFISVAATTGSKLTIKRAPINFLELELLKLEKMGLKFSLSKKYKSYNGKTELVDITVLPSKLKSSADKIHALPYPGINSDNLPFFVPIATQSEGTTLIHDWMWENRAIYFTELNRLGANITLADPHRVFVSGKTKLKATQVVCPPALRPAMIILIAMLAAEGTSVLRNVYSINRGYEEIAERLNSIGAQIRVLGEL